jgi:CBS domain-containing protein/sporulation protein YlmC with PRC-barrel domain
MAFVSELMGRSVVDADCAKVGHLKDLVASGSDAHHPAIVAVEVRARGRSVLVPFSEVAVLVAPAIPLKGSLDSASAYEPVPTDLFLVRDVLDQQIIDVNDVRVVRVNDIELARINGNFYIANVDIGGAGLARRLGLPGSHRRGRAHPARGMISWDDVEPISKNRQLRLKVPGQKITDLHPADLAEILSDLGKTDGSKLLESLDARTAAETLEEVEPDFQASLVRPMPDQKVADVLGEMSPDEAADLLAELPRHRSRELLRMMGKEDSADVRKLLSYPEDTAGGLMTTEFITISLTSSAASAMKTIRRTAHEAETIYYVYVTDRAGKLAGIISLKDLVLAEPRTKVVTFMQDRMVSMHIGDSQDTVAQAVSKYNLLAVPVVDDEGRLQGIVTADDALDKIIPTAWKKRLPRLYH